MAERAVVGSLQHRAASTGAAASTDPSNEKVATVRIGYTSVTGDTAAVLQTESIGAGIAVVLYDPEALVGGLLHFLLPDSSIDEGRSIAQPGVFADTGIDFLLHEMKLRGAVLERLGAHVVGGADPACVGITSETLALGQRNVRAALERLGGAEIRHLASRTGGRRARRVELEMATGTARITEAPPHRSEP